MNIKVIYVGNGIDFDTIEDVKTYMAENNIAHFEVVQKVVLDKVG